MLAAAARAPTSLMGSSRMTQPAALSFATRMAPGGQTTSNLVLRTWSLLQVISLPLGRSALPTLRPVYTRASPRAALSPVHDATPLSGWRSAAARLPTCLQLLTAPFILGMNPHRSGIGTAMLQH